jgi:hypothetical protein
MIQIEALTGKAPYGVNVVRNRDKIRLTLKTGVGTEYYVLLPRAVAEHLREQLDAALSAAAPSSGNEAEVA